MTAELLKLIRIDQKEQYPRGKDFCLWICLRAWKTKNKNLNSSLSFGQAALTFFLPRATSYSF